MRRFNKYSQIFKLIVTFHIAILQSPSTLSESSSLCSWMKSVFVFRRLDWLLVHSNCQHAWAAFLALLSQAKLRLASCTILFEADVRWKFQEPLHLKHERRLFGFPVIMTVILFRSWSALPGPWSPLLLSLLCFGYSLQVVSARERWRARETQKATNTHSVCILIRIIPDNCYNSYPHWTVKVPVI